MGVLLLLIRCERRRRLRTDACFHGQAERPWDTRRVETDGPDRAATKEAGRDGAAVDLYWLPLGAGGHFVRLNGRIYEALAARMQRRPVCDLYHSALQVELAADRFVIERPRCLG